MHPFNPVEHDFEELLPAWEGFRSRQLQHLVFVQIRLSRQLDGRNFLAFIREKFDSFYGLWGVLLEARSCQQRCAQQKAEQC